MTQNRYRTENSSHSPQYYEVECPKCTKLAFVRFSPHYPKSPYHVKVGEGSYLSCEHCAYLKRWRKQSRVSYTLSLKIFCPECGHYHQYQQHKAPKKFTRIMFSCQKCGVKRPYRPTVAENSLTTSHRGIQRDPFFSAPLWLQARINKNIIWAYNREHLSWIKAYIKADLREKDRQYLMTKEARLPTFLKLAKNRQPLLKLIDKMMRRT